jgi:hypothetical protein
LLAASNQRPCRRREPACTLGREDVIPEMFRSLVARLDGEHPGQFGRLREYLDRHVDVDEHRHAPMARRLLAQVCGQDADRWSEAEQAARQALEARVALWDGVLARCVGRSPCA